MPILTTHAKDEGRPAKRVWGVRSQNDCCYGGPVGNSKNVDRAAAALAIEAFLRAIGRDPSSEPRVHASAR